MSLNKQDVSSLLLPEPCHSSLRKPRSCTPDVMTWNNQNELGSRRHASQRMAFHTQGDCGDTFSSLSKYTSMVGRMLDHRWLMKDRWSRMTYEGHLLTYDLWRTVDHIWLIKDTWSHMTHEGCLLTYELWRTLAQIWLIKNPCSCMTYEGPLLTYDLWRPCKIPPRWLDQQQSLCSAKSLRLRDVQWCD